MSPVTNAAAGFFGELAQGRKASEERKKAQLRAIEKLRDYKLAEQKALDATQNQVRDEAVDIMNAMTSAGPDELPGLQRRIAYLRKTADPGMLPAEFLDETYGSVITEEGAEKITPGRQYSAGQLVPSDTSSLGDPKAGADRLSKGGMRRVTPEEVAAFDQERKKTVRGLTGKVAVSEKTPFHIRAGYGSVGEMRKGEFKKDMHAGVLDILTKGGKQPAKAGLLDDATWDAAKNTLYTAGESVGMTSKEMDDVVARFEKDRKATQEGKASDLERIEADTKMLHAGLNVFFGQEPGLLGEIGNIEEGDQPLHRALLRSGYAQIISGEKDITSILYGLTVSAERFSDANGGTAFKVAQLRQDRDWIEKPLGSYPDYAEDHLKNVPNSHYIEETDTIVHIDENGQAVKILRGQKAIDDATRTVIDIAEAVENDTFMPTDDALPEPGKGKIKTPAKTVENPSGVMGRVDPDTVPHAVTSDASDIPEAVFGGLSQILGTAADYWRPENIRSRANEAYDVGKSKGEEQSFINDLMGGS